MDDCEEPLVTFLALSYGEDNPGNFPVDFRGFT
jgi:hypothetical protein